PTRSRARRRESPARAGKARTDRGRDGSAARPSGVFQHIDERDAGLHPDLAHQLLAARHGGGGQVAIECVAAVPDLYERRQRGALVLEGHGRRVLKRDAGRVEDGDLLVRLATLELAADHLADLARDVALGDQPLPESDVDLPVGNAVAAVVHEDARTLQDRRVALLLALEGRGELRDVRAGLDPRVVDDPAPGVGPSDNDVGAAHGSLEVDRPLDHEVWELRP